MIDSIAVKFCVSCSFFVVLYIFNNISLILMQECLCALVVDDSEEISAAAQDFMEYLFSASGKHYVEHDIAAIFSRFYTCEIMLSCN